MANMGIGRVGSPNTIIKTTYRWLLEISTPCGLIPSHYVQTASRPSRETDEVVIEYLNATTYLPGKSRWQPMTVTYLDAVDAEMLPLYNWLCTISDIADPVTLLNSEKAGWNGTAFLTMLDGCGTPLEYWFMGSVFPQSVDFGELSMAESGLAKISMTLRFSEVSYKSACPNTQLKPCFKGC